jgi:predicted nuclease of restriction endonuclease-like (RecB) superfamily
MSKSNLPAAIGFPGLLKEIKARIQRAQTRAVLSVNAELVRLYWDIGRMINARQHQEGWGAAVIPRLARELHNELSEEKGFSERNIKRMLAFYRAYPDPTAIVPQAVAQLPTGSKVPGPVAPIDLHSDSILWSIPWGHHALLMEKSDKPSIRIWYMAETLANGWSRSVLLAMIQSAAHRRKGKAISNFERLLPAPQSDLVRQALKDPYIFDFLTLHGPFHERELEVNLLQQMERFLLELGRGFAFVGRQVRIEISKRDFYVDLLFYHLNLRCYVVIELKTGEFKPEYAGKMNFYLGVVDDKLRHTDDAPSIGLILSQERNHIVAEYALRGMSKPIGISEYEFTRVLPASLRPALPTVEQIEAELGAPTAEGLKITTMRRKKKRLSKRLASTPGHRVSVDPDQRRTRSSRMHRTGDKRFFDSGCCRTCRQGDASAGCPTRINCPSAWRASASTIAGDRVPRSGSKGDGVSTESDARNLFRMRQRPARPRSQGARPRTQRIYAHVARSIKDPFERKSVMKEIRVGACVIGALALLLTGIAWWNVTSMASAIDNDWKVYRAAVGDIQRVAVLSSNIKVKPPDGTTDTALAVFYDRDIYHRSQDVFVLQLAIILMGLGVAGPLFCIGFDLDGEFAEVFEDWQTARNERRERERALWKQSAQA